MSCGHECKQVIDLYFKMVLSMVYIYPHFMSKLIHFIEIKDTSLKRSWRNIMEKKIKSETGMKPLP